MKKFKIGDKVKVKENFWEIQNGVNFNDNKKKLVGRTLEILFVYDNGDVSTKQDDSNDDTVWSWDKDWLELSTEITWDNLKTGDAIIDKEGNRIIVLGVLTDLIIYSVSGAFNGKINLSAYKKQYLQATGHTIQQTTPPEKPETKMTIAQIEEKLNITGLKII